MFTVLLLSSWPTIVMFFLPRPKHFAEQDMIKNLRNVAIPGTGIPMSWHCFFKATVYILILILNPVMCFLSAINMQRKHGR